MTNFIADVKVGNMLIKTQVFAEDSYKAKLLLERQYGVGNVIGMPQRT
jgi:hypothetical protein